MTVGGKTVGAIGAGLFAVSQFTLYADTREGDRPSFTDVAPPEQGEDLYRAYLDSLRAEGVRVATGALGANMRVSLVNDGPVTILLEARRTPPARRARGRSRRPGLGRRGSPSRS